MSENSEQGNEEQNVQPLSHKRILILMACAALSGSAASLLLVSGNFAAGVLLGGALAVGNYYWLTRSVKVVIDAAVAGAQPRFLAGRYLSRYLAFAVLLALVYLSKAVPVTAVLLGLASFAAAIIIEAFIRIFKSFSK